MGVSFKVAKAGTRYGPKMGQIEDKDHGNGSLSDDDTQQGCKEGNVTAMGEKDVGRTDYLAKPELHSEDFQVSFSVNLFTDGFSVGKDTEIFNDVPKKLHPYDRASETLFTAIEYGWLPGDVFENMPCKYVNGALLCEIRDYRNCSSQRPSTVKSPVIHRVLLQMCMETVVKDMLSLSDDSWSYEDLLVVESRILKALQPELNLSPNLLLEKYPGKPLMKKLNLGVSSGWKKRRLSDGPKPATTATGGYQSQNSNCVSGLGYPAKPFPCSQQAVSISVQTLPENNITCSPSDPLMVSYPLANSCSRSPKKLPTSAAIVSVQKQYICNCEKDMKETSLLVPAETDRYETEATQRPIMKKPKQEPIDLSQDQRHGSQADGIDSGYFYQHQLPGIPAPSSPAFKLQWKNNVSYQNTDPEKNQYGILYKEGYPLSSTKGYQQASEGIPILQDAIPASMVKQEPNKTNTFLMSDVLCLKEKHFMMDIRNNPCNLQSTPLLSANTPCSISLGTGFKHPLVRNLRDEAVEQKRKALQREASAPAKQRKNSHSKGLSVGTLDALAGTTNLSAANARNISRGSVHLPPNSEDHCYPLLQRFLKIERVTQRHQLNNRKRKLDQLLPGKPYSCIFPLVASKHEDDSENGKQKDLMMERTPLPNCFIDRRLNVPKTRILIYMYPPHICHGVETPKIDAEPQIKMLMSEKLNERMVEARLLYGQEETDLPLLLTFPNTHFANLFTTQFTSLMAREGYRLVSDTVVPIPVNAIHSSSSQKPTVTISSATQTAGRTLELPSSTVTCGSSPTLPTALTGTMSAGQPLPNALAGDHLHTVNSQETLQLPGGILSKPVLDVAALVNPAQPHWQEILSKRAHLHFQMMQREKLQQQLMQRKLMVESLGASMGGMGTIQLGGGSGGLGLFGDFLSMEGSTLIKGATQIPCIGNFGLSDNIGGVIPDQSAAVPISLTTAESKRKTWMKGILFQQEAGVVPRAPTFSDMAHILNKRQPPQPLTNQQQILNQHQMRFPLQTQAPASSTEYASSHLTEVSSQQFEQKPLLNHGSTLQLMNRGNLMAGPQRQGLISQIHRSVSINKASSLRNVAEFAKDEYSQ
ncbi:hypothetical protein SLE2022_097510 [Rubroshorea leprosula]